jgi:hypothetical protein
MKKITRSILTLLAWELLVISQKDRTFKRVLKKKKWFEKISYIFETLVNFNKSIVEDTSKEFEKMDITWTVKKTFKDTTEQLHILYENLQDQVAILEDKVLDLSETWKEEAFQQLDYVKEIYGETKKTLKTIATDMIEKNKLEEKLVAIKKNIDTLRKSLK